MDQTAWRRDSVKGLKMATSERSFWEVACVCVWWGGRSLSHWTKGPKNATSDRHMNYCRSLEHVGTCWNHSTRSSGMLQDLSPFFSPGWPQITHPRQGGFKDSSETGSSLACSNARIAPTCPPHVGREGMGIREPQGMKNRGQRMKWMQHDPNTRNDFTSTWVLKSNKTHLTGEEKDQSPPGPSIRFRSNDLPQARPAHPWQASPYAPRSASVQPKDGPSQATIMHQRPTKSRLVWHLVGCT